MINCLEILSTEFFHFVFFYQQTHKKILGRFIKISLIINK